MRIRSTFALGVALIFALGLFACAHTRDTCQSRAEERYRHCVNPYMVVNQGDNPQPVQSDQAEGCRQAYQQALSMCAGGPEAPVVDLFPDAGVRTSTAGR